MCSGRQSRPHLFHVVRKVCTKSGHVSTIPPVVKNNSHHGISTIKSDYPISQRDRELAEASGRLLEKRLDRIDERLKNLQDQLEASDKKAPIRSIWTGAVAGVLTAVASYFVMKYVTMPTTIPFTTPTTTANSKIEEVSIDYSDY